MRAALPLLALLVAASPQDRKPDEKKMKHTNRLAKEKSPYLLQHAHNPVDWYPWGDEAFEKAKKEDKPVFLSIGYSTCHWCHVMEHESFEDEEVAKILNERFVAIKVDREERPDVDAIYMAAVQAMTQRGGWPLSAWLTPDRRPFFGGTYFPKEDRGGMPGFKRVLAQVAEVWKSRRGDIEKSADELTGILRRMAEAAGPGAVNVAEALERGRMMFERGYDPDHGGFSGAPKFPRSMTISFLLRRHRRSGSPDLLAKCEKTLEEMARGGMYDQLGGGFHRYSTDARWIVPHFEKMLYDNALLAGAYVEAWQVTKKDFYRRIACETLEYVLRDMTSKEGAFFSAEDADSEGIEGKFYVWNPKQLREVLGDKDAERFGRAYDVTDEGNWDPHEESIPKHQSVLRVVADGDFADLEKKLLEARSRRVRPGLDDKVLTSWNGLMITAFCQAAQAFDEPRYRDAAVRAARFLLEKHRKPDGTLLRTSRHGEAKIDGYLEDYAALAAAMLDLYETTFDPAWFEEARRLAARAIDLFRDGKAGGFFSTEGGKDLIARMREEYEGAVPTGNALMAMTLLRLHAMTGEAAYRERAEKTVQSFKGELERYPAAFPYLLCAFDWLQGGAKEVVLAGPDTAELLRAVRRAYVPNKVVAFADGKKPAFPLLEGKGPVNGKSAAYVCENMACKLPVTDPKDLEELLKK
jgi:hypothetical protein